jgi:hypothetical protein
MERLEDHVAWYDRKGLANQRNYKRIKFNETKRGKAMGRKVGCAA